MLLNDHKLIHMLKNKRLITFFAILVITYLVWLYFFTTHNLWELFSSFWPMSLTMALGSFVAGSSAIGGGGVAYPIFTKVLHIEAHDARTFSLLIQSAGMSMATLFIWAHRVKVLPRVILLASIGGFIGMLIGTFLFIIPSPYHKLSFTYIISIFGIVLLFTSRNKNLDLNDSIRNWSIRKETGLVLVGVLGGLISANIGSGLDIITFIVLTLAFGIHEKIGTPTCVVIMAINAVFGALLHVFVLRDVGVVYQYWAVCVPVVIIGAPFGAFILSKASRKWIVYFMLSLIFLEFSSTLLLIEQSFYSYLLGFILFIVFGVWFYFMLQYRIRKNKEENTTEGALTS